MDINFITCPHQTSFNCITKHHPRNVSFSLDNNKKIYVSCAIFQDHHVPYLRNMSTIASSVGSKEGLKLLVNGGPRAQKMVGIWLFGSAAWVFSMVVLGGLTRLTRSGLSMTDWKFTGSLPPLSEEDWLLEFEKYKQSPEYKRLVRKTLFI